MSDPDASDVPPRRYSLRATKPALASSVLPPVRGGHSACLASLQLVIFGGHAYLGNGAFQYLEDVWVLDCRSLAWSKVDCCRPLDADEAPDGNNFLGLSGRGPRPPGPVARYGHTATLVGSRMFVFGGRGANGVNLRDLWYLDLQTWRWVPVSATTAGPMPRFYHAATAVGRKLVLHGGWSGTVSTKSRQESSGLETLAANESRAAKSVFDDLWVFDTDTFVWVKPRTGGLAPKALYGHTLNLSPDGESLLLFGGVTVTPPSTAGSGSAGGGVPQYFNDVRSLSTRTLLWSRPRNVGSVVSERYAHTLTSLCDAESGLPTGRYVLFGGWGYGGMQSPDEGNKKAGASSIFVLDRGEEGQEQGETSREWTWTEPDRSGGGALTHKYGHTTTDLGGGVLFVFGGWNGKQATNEIVVIELREESIGV